MGIYSISQYISVLPSKLMYWLISHYPSLGILFFTLPYPLPLVKDTAQRSPSALLRAINISNGPSALLRTVSPSALLRTVSLSNGPSALLRAVSLSNGSWTLYEAIKAALFIRGKKGNVEFQRGNMAEALRESNGGKRNGGIKETDSY